MLPFRVALKNRAPPRVKRCLAQLLLPAERPNRQFNGSLTLEHPTPKRFPLRIPSMIGHRSSPRLEKPQLDELAGQNEDALRRTDTIDHAAGNAVKRFWH